MPKAPVLEKLDSHVADLDIHGNMPNHNTSPTAHANLFGPINAAISVLQGQASALAAADASFSTTINAIQSTLDGLSQASSDLQEQVSGISGANSGFLFSKVSLAIVGKNPNNDNYDIAASKLGLTSRVGGADLLYLAGFMFWPQLNYTGSYLGGPLNLTSSDMRDTNILARWRAGGTTFSTTYSGSTYSGTYPASGYYITRSSSGAPYLSSGGRVLGNDYPPAMPFNFSTGSESIDFCLVRTEGPSLVWTLPAIPAPDNPGS
jgi:hypothetical protein